MVVVDDHEMVVVGLKAMLAPFAGRVRVVGTANGAEEALDVALVADPRHRALRRPAARRQRAGPVPHAGASGRRSSKVVLLSVYDDEQYLYQALRAGAAGYLLKRHRRRGARAPPRARRHGDDRRRRDDGRAGGGVRAARMERDEFWPGAHLGLTQRESEVLALLVAGHSNRAIAGQLVIGDETVKSHVRSLLRKLQVPDRTAAVAAALREGVFR